MTASLKAEWLRLITLRTFYRMLAAAGVVAALIAFIDTATTAPPWDLSEPLRDGNMSTLVTTSVTVFALILGARSFTEDFRHNTIVHTFVADPVRIRSTLAKGLVSGVAAGILTATSVVTMATVAYAMSALSGGDLAYHGGDVAAGVGLVAAGVAWGVLGVGLGALVRQQVPAVVGGMLWLLVVENLFGGLLGDVSSYLPGQVAQALAQLPEAANGMTLPVAGLVMSTYAVALWLAGLFSMRQKDVS